jgi:tRNA(fMet)-specific endonuclease VapC
VSLYVLDTDHVTLYQRNEPRVVTRIAGKSYENIAVTLITAEEQLRGWLKYIRRASSREGLVLAYARLRLALDYFCRIRMLDFDDHACTSYESLRQQRIRIGTRDLRIAAIALSVGGILVTRNQRDFSSVPGLILEDWSTG